MECRNQLVRVSRQSKAPLLMILGVAALVTAFALMSSIAQSERNAKAQKENDIVSSARSAAILSQLESMNESERDFSGASTDDFLRDLMSYTGLYENQKFEFDPTAFDTQIPEQDHEAEPKRGPAEPQPQAPVVVQAVESDRDKAVKALQERRAAALLKALSATSSIESAAQTVSTRLSDAAMTGAHGAVTPMDTSSAAALGPNSRQYLNEASSRLVALNTQATGQATAGAAGGSGGVFGGIGGSAYVEGRTMDAYRSLSFSGSSFDTSLVGEASEFTLMQGSVVPCVLLTGVNSDLPGMVQAQVSADVYDSATGNHVLIPKGSKLLGQYASGPMRGQERLMFGFNRLIFPNGRSIQLGAMPASSRDGYAGIGANVDSRFFEILGNAILLGGVTAGIALSVDDADRDDDGNLTVNGALSQGLGQSMGRVITQLIERNMNIAPTLTIKPGYEFNVTLSQDVNFAL